MCTCIHGSSVVHSSCEEFTCAKVGMAVDNGAAAIFSLGHATKSFQAGNTPRDVGTWAHSSAHLPSAAECGAVCRFSGFPKTELAVCSQVTRVGFSCGSLQLWRPTRITIVSPPISLS